ncbi:MAG: cupin-like domain-containing protein [Acidimicrobiales bacterium]
MTAPLDVIDMPHPDEFVERWLAPARPVVVRGLSYDRQAWTAGGLRARAGSLPTLVYGSLFDLEDVATLDDYLDDWFIPAADGSPAVPSPPPLDPGDDVPYVRWYNRLRDVEAAWGDEALARMADTWTAPACLPRTGLVMPVGGGDPVVDRFPYRGLLVAARGARTRLHRDPFGTDAVVAQFAGVKEAVLYEPGRAGELHLGGDATSYGGFLDVRGDGSGRLAAEPDLAGEVHLGDLIYIPRGWLHDVLVVEDSLSVTWNFVHEAGSRELLRYLQAGAEADSEWEILRWFRSQAGCPDLTPAELAAELRQVAV